LSLISVTNLITDSDQIFNY